MMSIGIQRRYEQAERAGCRIHQLALSVIQGRLPAHQENQVLLKVTEGGRDGVRRIGRARRNARLSAQPLREKRGCGPVGFLYGRDTEQGALQRSEII